MKKIWIIVLAAAAAIALIVTAVIALSSGETKNSWQEQYDLGVRYLNEGNYEEAIIAFTAAIDISPKNGDAYIGLADAFLGMDDARSAKDTLIRAMDAVGSPDREMIESKLAELSSSDSQSTDSSGIAQEETYPSESNGFNEELIRPSILSAAVTDDMLRFEEINFLGHSIVGLDIDTMKAYMQENGMYLTTNDDLDPNNDDEYWCVIAKEYDFSWSSSITALQYKNSDHVTLWGYDASSDGRKEFPIGIRDIYTFDPLDKVLMELGFSNVGKIIDYIDQIRKDEYASMDDVLDAYHSALFCVTDGLYCSLGPFETQTLDNGKELVMALQIVISFKDYPDYRFCLRFGLNNENDEENDRLLTYKVYID